MKTKQSVRKIKDLPSPKGHFILGHLPQFKAYNKHQVMEEWAKECGDLYKINFAGLPFVVSANSSINQQILKQRPDKFSRLKKMENVIEELGILGLFNTEGETWKRHRKIAAEALNMRKVKAFFPVILEKAGNLLAKWKKHAEAGHAIDVQNELMLYTVDVTTEIAFGHKMDSINDGPDALQKHLELIFPAINERATAPIPIWKIIKRKKDKDLQHALKEVEQIVHKFIAEAKQRLAENPELKESPQNFLEAMLVEKGGEQFSDQEIYSNVFTILLAGEDTTSNSISWALYYLAQKPELVEKAKAEAEQVYPNSLLVRNQEQFRELKYAMAIAEEAIRLKPTTPVLYHQAQEEVVIDNFLIPKGTKILTHNHLAQIDEQFFSQPNEFVPERWIKGACPMHAHHPQQVTAFGGGPRYCPGKNLAMHEMVVMISAVCKHFELEMVGKPEEVREQFSFTMYPDNLRILMRERSLS